MKTMKLFLLFIPLLIFNDALKAQTFITEEGKATFYSSVPLHTFSGVSNYLAGLVDLEKKVVDFYLDLSTLETGIKKRDRDMLETLESEKYPFAEFYGTLTSDFNPDISTPQNAIVSGNFKIHGIQKEAEFSGTLEMTAEGLVLKASWVLLLADYDIVPPSLLFVKVDQEQKIEIEALLKPQKD